MNRLPLLAWGLPLASLLLAPTVDAQPSDPQAGAGEKAAVRAVIDRLFDGMRAGDSTAVRATFAPSIRLMTVATPEGGGTVVRETPADQFVAAVGAPRSAVWDERIWDLAIRRAGPLASAWGPYAFYLGHEMSHCGTNAFQLARLGGTWKIVQITDTRRTDCIDFVPEAFVPEGARSEEQP